MSLDKLAHGVAQARATGQFDHLKPQEDAFVEHLLDLAPDTDQRAVGAAWLILGQLIATGISQHPEHLQLQALGNLLNAARLAGQRLYSGAELVHPCPIPRSNGTACRFTAKGTRQEVLDAMMRAHVAVYHPGQRWPAVCVICDEEPGTVPGGRGPLCQGCADLHVATAIAAAELPTEAVSDSAHPGWNSGLEDLRRFGPVYRPSAPGPGDAQP